MIVYLYCRPEYDDPRSGQEDTVRQTVMLGEEFLGLLITLLSKFFFNLFQEYVFYEF